MVPAEPSLYSNVERAVAKSTSSVIFLEVSGKRLAVIGVSTVLESGGELGIRKNCPLRESAFRCSARRFGGITKMSSGISGLNPAALATMHSRVSLAFDICFFLLLVACNTVVPFDVGPPHKNSTTRLQTGSRITQIHRTGSSEEFNISFRFLRYGEYAFSIRLNLAGSALPMLRQEDFESRCRWR